MISFECLTYFQSSPPEVSLAKGVPKICSKFTGEYPCQSVISIKLVCNCSEITLWHGHSPVNLLHILRTSFTKDTSGWMLLLFVPNKKKTSGLSNILFEVFRGVCRTLSNIYVNIVNG